MNVNRFGKALIDAGLGGLQISFGSDGVIEYGDSVTQSQKDAVSAVLEGYVDADDLVVSATPWQFRKALNQTGLRAAVESAVAQADQETKDGYQFATEFRSDDPIVLAAAAAVGKSPDEAYELIAFAKTL